MLNLFVRDVKKRPVVNAAGARLVSGNVGGLNALKVPARLRLVGYITSRKHQCQI